MCLSKSPPLCSTSSLYFKEGGNYHLEKHLDFPCVELEHITQCRVDLDPHLILRLIPLSFAGLKPCWHHRGPLCCYCGTLFASSSLPAALTSTPNLSISHLLKHFLLVRAPRALDCFTIKRHRIVKGVAISSYKGTPPECPASHWQVPALRQGPTPQLVSSPELTRSHSLILARSRSSPPSESWEC